VPSWALDQNVSWTNINKSCSPGAPLMPEIIVDLLLPSLSAVSQT
jgi:hypothetical protein